MALAAGQTLTHYAILAPLGAGGMGEVYRARDTRLDRDVAIKVLPEELADDEERLRRFEREAKTLASLSHANLAHVYGIDQVDDTCFIAMELVPGEDLATRLARGELTLDEAVDVCRQIAEGLEAAHEAGVVHRDLKPANVRVTPEGVVKILDFGLAKPIHPRETGEGTTTAEADSFLVTEEGLVLGTPTYMSPEQARGKPVDRRTDLWAFGCVLYECLTGKRAFGGESLTDVLAGIVEREPDWSRIPAGAGADVRWLLRRCLTKDPRLRLRDAGEARVWLSGAASLPSSQAPVTGRRGAWLGAFGVGVAVTALAWVASSLLHAPGVAEVEPAVPRGPMQLTVGMPGGAGTPLISPDGERLLYWQDQALWVRRLAEREPRPVPGSEGAQPSGSLAWSPDGQAVAFARDGFLETLRLGESTAERLCAVPDRIVDLSWAEDGGFLAEIGGRSEGIFYLAPGERELVQLDWLDPAALNVPHRFNPSFLPGGDRFLFVDSSGDEPWIRLGSLSSRSSRPLVLARSRAVYVEPGWIAWTEDGRLLVQAFDPETSSVSGSPRQVVEGVDSFASTGTSNFSFSNGGNLLYVPMEQSATIEWIDRQGRALGPAADPRPFSNVRLDRTGRWLAASVVTPEDGLRDIWIVDLERGIPQRFTNQEGWESTPAWSPDGKRLAFAADWSGPPNVYVQDVDGGGPTELVPFDNHVQYASSWSADGRWVLYQRTDPSTSAGDLWMVDVETLERRPLLVSPANESYPEASPDGRWLAYTSDESGRTEVYVATFPELRGARRVSAEGGRLPRWTGDSSELYYMTASRAIASAVVEGREGLPNPGPEVIVIQASEDLAQFDLTPDADRFLVVRTTENQVRPVAHLVLEWERLVER